MLNWVPLFVINECSKCSDRREDDKLFVVEVVCVCNPSKLDLDLKLERS
jgi:hypothetical protein